LSSQTPDTTSTKTTVPANSPTAVIVSAKDQQSLLAFPAGTFTAAATTVTVTQDPLTETSSTGVVLNSNTIPVNSNPTSKILTVRFRPRNPVLSQTVQVYLKNDEAVMQSNGDTQQQQRGGRRLLQQPEQHTYYWNKTARTWYRFIDTVTDNQGRVLNNVSPQLAASAGFQWSFVNFQEKRRAAPLPPVITTPIPKQQDTVFTTPVVAGIASAGGVLFLGFLYLILRGSLQRRKRVQPNTVLYSSRPGDSQQNRSTVPPRGGNIMKGVTITPNRPQNPKDIIPTPQPVRASLFPHPQQQQQKNFRVDINTMMSARKDL